MNLKEYTGRPVEVKVIDSTHTPNDRTKAMIGGIYEVKVTDNSFNIRYVWDKDKMNYWDFNESDLQVMTPLSFKGERIGIGDMVNGGIVYDCVWYDGVYCLTVANNNKEGFERGCHIVSDFAINRHTPLHPSKPNTEEVEEAKALLEKAGVLVDGKVLK